MVKSSFNFKIANICISGGNNIFLSITFVSTLIFHNKTNTTMFKKLLTSTIVGLFAIATYGQTIVSTSPQNKNVVLEEFTGIHCVYCPSGHAIAKSIQDANPDKVSLINIHAGSFSNPGPGEPDFRTAYGTALANQSGLVGYPAATVNRTNFPGREQGAPGTTALNRNNWAWASNNILGQSSNVNVGVEATIDVTTGILTVHVEAYYTANSPQSTNLLNVALMQNNTKGPQTGGNMCDQYVHMHRLVDMITGQWGEEITNTTAGTFVDRTYVYAIPADYRGVPVEIADMEVAAYISETHQTIPSGNRAYPTYLGLLANDANLKQVIPFKDPCANLIAPEIVIQNTSQNTLNSLEISYSVNGEPPLSYTWTGTLTPMQYEEVTLPEMRFVMGSTNTLTVTLPNDDNNANNTGTFTFNKAYDATTTINMELKTDQYGSECRWDIKDFAGTIIYKGGPYGANQTINETFTLPSNCYIFSVRDTYGDGGGPVKLTDTDPNNTVFWTTDGKFGCGTSVNFSTDGFILNVGNSSLEDVSVFPNPATTILNVLNAEDASIQVYDVLGKLILSKTDIALQEQLDVSRFQTGTYFLKISKDNMVTTKRFIISK